MTPTRPSRRTLRNKLTLAALLAAQLLVVVAVAPAQDVALSALGTVHPGFRLEGFSGYDYSGYSVSGAGDVNGDGLADVIVGAWQADANGVTYAGESYVIFGKTDTTAVSLSSLGAGGFRIEGADAYGRSGVSVSGAGDVNGDGLADLIVGAFSATPNGAAFAGESYVVFGKTDNTAVSLASLGAGGYRIAGIDASDQSGFSVSGAGDVNGDGLADLIVGAYYADPNGAGSAGESYVVFGKTGSTAVSLAGLGAGGFRIDGIDVNDQSGRSVSGAGDVNGDGLADLIVGAWRADPNSASDAGESYVVFGKTDSTAVSLGSLGAGGFRIDGIDANDYSGVSVSGAGDVNGDGLADLIVGAKYAEPGPNIPLAGYSGESYVVFGKTDSSAVSLASMGTGGFRIDGASDGDRSGTSVSGAGDVNGDGLADLIVGAPFPDGGTGKSYVIYGKTGSGAVSLAGLGADGFSINGVDRVDFSGRSVSGAGDVNGDGLADLLVAAPFAQSVYAPRRSGESYVVFSTATPPASATYRSRARAANAARVATGVTGDGSNDSTPDARVWIDFADGDADSTQTVRLMRDKSELTIPAGAADVAWEITSDRTAWTSGRVTFKYLDSEITSLDEGSILICHASTASGPWTPLPNITRDNAKNTVSGDVSSFSYFALVDATVQLVDAAVQLSALGTVDPGFRIDGIDPEDRSGRSVSGAGDVNGDGLADLIVGADFADPNGAAFAGESYVVFGKTDNTAVSLSALGAGGFRIDGIDANDGSGQSVSGAGDVNGDGLADLIVGAPGGVPGGECYVVFGKTGSAAVSLASLGVGGFRIDAIDAGDRVGVSVSGAGDVNGDGLDDVIVGADLADPNGFNLAGESYVVFGKTDSTAVSLATLGAGGFRIEGIDTEDYSGFSVSGSGDVNGDGLADLIVGAYRADLTGADSAGESYVVFGKTDSTAVSLAALGAGGFRINGSDSYGYSGRSVSGAGDVNGDGLADLLVGAPNASLDGVTYAGEAYVVFGKTGSTAVNIAALGAGGFRIDGIDDSDQSGRSVSGAGDVNGDGLADIIVGASNGDPNAVSNAGESYVVYGKTDSQVVSLSALGAGGFRVDGIAANDTSGSSVSGAGDVNGDGLADLIVGANQADPGGRISAGESYVIFSTVTPPVSASYKSIAGAADAARVATGVTGDGSNSSTPDSRAWLDFADGAAASTQTVRLMRNNNALSGISNAAEVAWEITSDRTLWNSGRATFKYLESEIAGLDESRLMLLQAPAATGPWTRVANQCLNTGKNTVEGDVKTLGFFAIMPGQNVALSALGTVHPGFRIDGIDAEDKSGRSVSGAGDVNGDGLADLIIGADVADPNGVISAGESYVVFGKTATNAVSLAGLGAGGFRIDGIDVEDRSGRSVSGAGDVNGDGLDDLIVGADFADPNGANFGGEAYVVFGKTDSTAVSLASLGAGGFRIDGSEAGDVAGYSVSGAGDVNGDGLADLIVGALGGGLGGESYVVFGKANTSAVSLSSLGAGGFRIDAIAADDRVGISVSGAGDVNGDGLDDLIVGADLADPNGFDRAGESYVVFGKTGSTAVSLATLGAGGFRIEGIDTLDYSGTSVSGAGDVNGDGLADLILGAPYADLTSTDSAGESYVVFGKTGSTAVSLAALGAGGFRLDGVDVGGNAGRSVSGAGDVNGDGIDDLIVGAPNARPDNVTYAGESYVVFGKTGSKAVNLGALGAGGFRIDGIDGADLSGRSVSGAGDVNGDGLADVIVGAPDADPNGNADAGESYVIFSGEPAPPTPVYVSVAGPGDSPAKYFESARLEIDFGDGAAASTQTVSITRNADEITGINNIARVVWEITSNRVGWTNGRLTFKYLNTEISGLNEGTLRIFKSSSPNGPWTPLPNITLDAAANTISGDVSSFSYFVIAGDTVLAVELGEFKATVVSGGVVVNWTTLLEEETAGFFVRRAIPTTAGGSTVGERINAEIIPAEGGASYSVLDPNGTKESLYYLEEITVDGSTKFYGPVGASTRNSNVGEWMAF